MTNKKIVIPTLIALVAIVAVAASPSVLAELGMKGHFKHQMDLPDLEFSEGSILVGENHFENAQNVIPITDALNSIGDGQVLQIGLKPVQEHIVYGAKVLSDDTVFGVIVDAGTGDVLYKSEGKSIQEIEEKIAEMKTRFAEGDFGKFHGMNGDYKKFFGMHG